MSWANDMGWGGGVMVGEWAWWVRVCMRNATPANTYPEKCQHALAGARWSYTVPR